MFAKRLLCVSSTPLGMPSEPLVKRTTAVSCGCRLSGADRRLTARRTNAKALVSVLDKVFATRPWATWRAVLDAHDLTFGVVGTVEDTRDDRQMVASGALVPIDDPRAGASLTVASPLWLEGVTKVSPRFAPGLGEHSVEILREAGYTDAEIDALLAARAVVQSKDGS